MMFEGTEQVTNTSAVPVEVWFEPWGKPHLLQPGETFHVVGQSEQQGELEIEQRSSAIAVYGWPGCTMKVFRGEELVEDFSFKVPELPPGMSAKTFIGFMFGEPGGPKPT